MNRKGEITLIVLTALIGATIFGLAQIQEEQNHDKEIHKLKAEHQKELNSITK